MVHKYSSLVSLVRKGISSVSIATVSLSPLHQGLVTVEMNKNAKQAQVYHQVVKDRPYSHILDLVPLAEGSTVLDLGCGTGVLTSFLAERVGPTGRIVGVDPDKERIKIAREQNRNENITFLVADGETFPEDQYNAVYSNIVMGSIENKQPVFNRVSKNLRTGGNFVLGVFLHLDPLAIELTQLMGPGRRQQAMKMWHYVPLEAYEELAKTNGFRVAKKEEDEIVYSYPNIDATMSTWYAATHGNFDPALVDPKVMEEFKEKYGNQEVEKKKSFARLVFTKI